MPAVTAPDSPPVVPVTLVEQSHGGALRHGNPGNKGGGRHPDKIRRKARKITARHLAMLDQAIAGDLSDVNDDGETVPLKVRERLKAFDIVSKLGMGAAVSMADVRERLGQQVDVIRGMLPKDQADKVIAALGKVWR